MGKVPEKSEKKTAQNPLILILSNRERIRDILSLGLLQCQYQILQAVNSDIASLKANQFIPDLIIADITQNNTKDILMIHRLQNSERTRNMPLLAVAPIAIKEAVEKIIDIKNSGDTHINKNLLHLIEYPFNFSDLLKKIQSILRGLNISIPDNKFHSINTEELNSRIAERIFDTSLPVEKKIQEISSVLQKQWIFPFTVNKALDIMGTESSCCAELAKCIKTDLSASAAILKVVNTITFAKRQNRITEIREAIVRLGFQQTRNLLSCFSLINLSPEVHAKSGFSRHDFWLHSLSVASIAEKLCTNAGFRRPELAFIAGLIHDLGKIPLDNNFDTIFPTLLDETTSRISSFYKTEQHLMSFTHADLGYHLTNEWNFPTSISLAILNHHWPENILQVTPAVDRILHESVYIANQISKAFGLGHSCDQILQEIPVQMLKDLKIPKGLKMGFISSIIKRLNQMAAYLNIPLQKLSMGQATKGVSVGEILFVYGSHAPFHPLILALENNGYIVQTAKSIPQMLDPMIKVIISMPDVGAPLDIMLHDDDKKSLNESPALKIFIMQVDPKKTTIKGFSESNMIFINQDNLDSRYILHVLDKFFGKVVIPEHAVV